MSSHIRWLDISRTGYTEQDNALIMYVFKRLAVSGQLDRLHWTHEELIMFVFNI